MDTSRIQRFLVVRIGQLGDTLISVPALWAIREHFSPSHVTLLADDHSGKAYVKAADVLRGSGMVDDFLEYPASAERASTFSLLRRLRAEHYDALVYLMPSCRSRRQIYRDSTFFHLCGIRRFYGIREAASEREASFAQKDGATLHESDRLLARLGRCGIPVPGPRQGRTDLNISKTEQTTARQWLVRHCGADARLWIAVGPGSKMPVKVWPKDRYAEVVTRLIDRFDVWPIVCGGREDSDIGRELVQVWGRGCVAAGELGIRETVALMMQCALFVGNDTGTMHMGAAAGTRCVGVFSARDVDGKWRPYGSGHVVLRKEMACAGCMRQVCSDRLAECITTIAADEVYDACCQVMHEAMESPHSILRARA